MTDDFAPPFAVVSSITVSDRGLKQHIRLPKWQACDRFSPESMSRELKLH